jgi:hypothetical protein
MKDEKVKALAELLGDNEDIHMDFYNASKSLLEHGLVFPFKLYIDNFTDENVVYSFFSLYRNYLQLISSLKNFKTIDDYPGKMLIWEDDEISYKLYKQGKLIWKKKIKIKDFDDAIKDKLCQVPQLMSFDRNEYKLKVKLVKPGFERKFNENTQFTADMKMGQELRLIKEKIIYAHTDSIINLNSSEQDFYGQLSRVIHRLKIWGYDLSKIDYYSPNFTELLKTQVNITSLHFRHTFALSLINQLFLEQYDNESLLKEVENRVNKEIQKLNEMFDYLKNLKA